MTARPVLDPADLDDVDLADPRLHAEFDLSAVWRRLRREEPVHRHRDTGSRDGFWVITRYSDVAAVYRDADRFTSVEGNVLDTLQAGGDSAAGKMLAVTDGRRHKDLRTVLLKAFTPHALGGVVDSVRRGTRHLLEDALRKGDCDFATDVAANIPIAAICDLLGVPADDRAHILSLTSSVLGSDDGVGTAADTWTAKNEILLYFAELAEARRADPGDDIISLLVGSQIGGERLTGEEVIFNCYSILLGGDETTRLAMITGMQALMDHPGQWQALKDDAVPIESAVEEILRWSTPAMHSGRSATGDVLLDGEFIEAGDIVTIWNASANFDEDQFDRPEVFDLGRRPNKHLTFAYGSHFCLGAYLARAEIGAVLSGLKDMVTSAAPDGPAKRVYSNFLNGMCSLPVSLTLDPAYAVPA